MSKKNLERAMAELAPALTIPAVVDNTEVKLTTAELHNITIEVLKEHFKDEYLLPKHTAELQEQIQKRVTKKYKGTTVHVSPVRGGGFSVSIDNFTHK